MRICYLFNSSLPSKNANSLQVIKTCEGLTALKNKVFLITPNTGSNESLKNFYDLEYYPKRIKINFFTTFPQGLNYYLFSFFSVLKSLSLKPDIYITRNPFTLLILNILKKRVIVEFHHDLSNEGRIVNLIYKFFKILDSKYIIKVVAITNPVKKYLINNLGVNKNKIHIIPSASSLKIKYSNLKIKRKYNIGYFGSLEKTKGSQFIIELSKLDLKNNYYIYGGDKEKIEQIKKENNHKNLYLSEHVSYKNLKKKINKMDILLMPSSKKILRSAGGVGNIAKFTSPLKLFDYLASGKLIIISNLNVLNEIIKEDKNCLIVKKLSLKHWYNIIKNIRSNLKKINYLKRNAYILSKKYTYKIRAKKILYLIN